ncbi:MAG: ATPase P [Clostridia bacterium]|nr:ATPase P [[Bacteroides] pectinophilus]MDD5873371.1 ATPase P [Clostridia bacterium]
MIFKPQRLGSEALQEDELVSDKKACRKFGPCGVGKRAIYLNSFYIDRQYYVPISSVSRIFKRVAMSKGGFTGKGVFGSLPYLVVEYDDGREKQCNFKNEEDVDRLIAYIEQEFPDIPVHSVEAQRKLDEKARRLALKQQERDISDEAKANIAMLEKAEKYLHGKSDLYLNLSQSAKKKRVYERSNPAYKWVALAITIMGAAAFIYGIYAMATHAGLGVYFLLFGLAAIFLFSGASVLPTSHNNRRYIEGRLLKAVDDMESYIKKYPDFPVPACYAHPIVLKRMQEILREGRADTIPEALRILKEDLKALNSSVVVEQEEYDEVVAIKPMFLVMDYK